MRILRNLTGPFAFLFNWLGGKKNVASVMEIRHAYNENYPESNGWYLMEENVAFAGPYKREQDAKGVLTRLRNKHIG